MRQARENSAAVVFLTMGSSLLVGKSTAEHAGTMFSLKTRVKRFRQNGGPAPGYGRNLHARAGDGCGTINAGRK